MDCMDKLQTDVSRLPACSSEQNGCSGFYCGFDCGCFNFAPAEMYGLQNKAQQLRGFLADESKLCGYHNSLCALQ